MHPIDVPDIRARELLTVIALAEYGSFVSASAFLKTSQPALTRTLKRVESVLGVMLFSRTTRRVEITPAGREFLAVAERILNDLRITLGNIREITTEQRGQVIVSTFATFANHPLPEIIRGYRETRPQIEVRVREGKHPDILEDIRGGAADFGISYVDTLPDTLQGVTLRREPLYVMLPGGHPLAVRKRARIQLADLQKSTFVSLPPDTYVQRLVDGAAATAGLTLARGVTVARFLGVVHYVRAGTGVGIVPAGALPPKPWRDFHAAPLSAPSLSVTIGLVMLRGRYVTPAAASLIALIRDYFKARDGGSASRNQHGGSASRNSPHVRKESTLNRT